MSKINNAYCTLLSTEDYLKGVLVLNQSLLDTKPKCPLIVLLSQGVSNEIEEILKSYQIRTQRLENLPELTVSREIKTGPVHWNYTFDKLQVFGMTQFEKLVFLDSDMLIMENIDELFQKQHMSAVGPAGGRYTGNEGYDGINSGLMVIEPNSLDFRNLIELIPSVMEETDRCSDQNVIIRYFVDDWRKKDDLHLDDKYNMIAKYSDYYINNLGYSLQDRSSEKNVKVLHFIGNEKPWSEKSGLFAFLKFLLQLIKMKIRRSSKDRQNYLRGLLIYKKYLLRYRGL